MVSPRILPLGSFLARLPANPFFFCVVTFVIATRDLELPFGDEEDDYETLAEPTIVEATPSVRKKKRKETTQAQDNVVQPEPPGRFLSL